MAMPPHSTNLHMSGGKRFHLLLVALLLQILISPFVTGVQSAIIQDLSFLFILLSALSGVRQSRLYPVIFGLTVFCGLGVVVKYLITSPLIFFICDGTGAIVLLLTIVEVSRYLARQRRVDLDTVFGGLCVYLFLGTLWFILYLLVDRCSPGAFAFTLHSHGLDVEKRDRLLFFFSYITLLTTGYGDIVPLSPLAQSLSVLEGLTGQFYLVFFIARLVGLHIAGAEDKHDSWRLP